MLIYLQTEFPFTHNLNTLHNLIPSDWRVTEVDADLDRLSEYAVDARYPGDWPDLSPGDAQASVRDARRVVDTVQADLDARLG